MAWRKVGEEIVVLDLETAQYLTLNDSGAVLWEALSERSLTVEELADELVRIFDVEADRARADVEEFLRCCHDAKMIDTSVTP